MSKGELARQCVNELVAPAIWEGVAEIPLIFAAIVGWLAVFFILCSVGGWVEMWITRRRGRKALRP